MQLEFPVQLGKTLFAERLIQEFENQLVINPIMQRRKEMFFSSWEKIDPCENSHELERMRRDLLREAARISAELTKLEKMPKDVYENGTILAFEKTFNGKKYDYAVIKCNGLWYTTGTKRQSGYTWQELLKFLSNSYGATVTDVYRVTQFEHEFDFSEYV